MTDDAKARAQWRQAFGRKLRELRQAARLEQEVIALEVGVSASTWRRWEQGISEPQLFEAQRIARRFQLRLDVLAE